MSALRVRRVHGPWPQRYAPEPLSRVRGSARHRRWSIPEEGPAYFQPVRFRGSTGVRWHGDRAGNMLSSRARVRFVGRSAGDRCTDRQEKKALLRGGAAGVLAHQPGCPAGPGKSLFLLRARSEGHIFLGWWAVARHAVRALYTQGSPGSALYFPGWGAPQHRGHGGRSVEVVSWTEACVSRRWGSGVGRSGASGAAAGCARPGEAGQGPARPHGQLLPRGGRLSAPGADAWCRPCRVACHGSRGSRSTASAPAAAAGRGREPELLRVRERRP